MPSIGSDFRTNALFFNDSWRISNRLTANVGIRYDKNDGKNQAGELVAKDDAISPRLGVIYDPTGTGDWSVTASYGRYVAAVANTIIRHRLRLRNWQFVYASGHQRRWSITSAQMPFVRSSIGAGPTAVRAGTITVPTPHQQGANPAWCSLADWRLALTPNNWEYAAGINRHFGSRATIAQITFSGLQGLRPRTDLSTGRVKNSLGREFDLTLIENANLYKRRYSGLTTQATYQFR
jgi:hypothetical protein